jgi:dihydroneopterin aldolase
VPKPQNEKWHGFVDRILIKGMQFYGYHGLTTQERKEGRHISVDVSLALDLSNAGCTDNLRHTVNYVSVYKVVRDVVVNEKYKLLETLATKIAEKILASFSMVQEVEVSVRKHSPPIGGVADYVEVRVLRGREK